MRKQVSDCIFCKRELLEPVAQNDLCYAIYDKYPVASLHTLILPKRCIQTPFDLTSDEQQKLFTLAHQCSIEIANTDPLVGGFNFGANIGKIAGQKIMHVHFHLIPRRQGDISPPPAMEDSGSDSKTD